MAFRRRTNRNGCLRGFRLSAGCLSAANRQKQFCKNPLEAATRLVHAPAAMRRLLSLVSERRGLAAGSTISAVASLCAELTATAPQPDTVARLHEVLHGGLAEMAIAAVHATPRVRTILLEAASAADTAAAVRVKLLACLAACLESRAYRELDVEAELTTLRAGIQILGEPDASMELQAAARRLLRAVQPDALRVGCVAHTDVLRSHSC